MKLIKLSVGGTVSLIDYPKYGTSTEWFAEQISCEWIEIVRPKGFDFVLVVDEEGLMRPHKINPIASYIYGTMYHGKPIVGDVLICMEKNGWLRPMSDQSAKQLAEKFSNRYPQIVKILEETFGYEV